ncbi:MAG: metallophosphoesterase [Terriglobales bacterium]
MDNEKRRFAVFFLTVLAIWTLMNAYVWWRIATLPVGVRAMPRAAFIGIAAFLWISYIAARFAERAGLTEIGRVLEWVGAHWLGIVFLALVCFLAADIVTGFGHWLTGVAPRLRLIAACVAAVLAIVANVQGRRAPVVHDYEVQLAGLPANLDGTKVVVLSDTHLGTMIGDDWLDQRIAEVQALRPDIIILAGDIIEGDDEEKEERLVGSFRKLSAPMGVWAVTGNHEYYAGLDHSLKLLHDAGARVLRDEHVELRPGLVLAGVDDLTARRQRGGEIGGYIDRALNGRAPGATIFISHSPMLPERAAALGANIMISGHTHSGQIWPFNYAVRAFYPLVVGRYNVNGMTAIVCRGTGTWGPRMRLWGRGEILQIVLRSGEKKS